MRTIKTVVADWISRSELLERLRRGNGSGGKVRLQHLVIRDFAFSEPVFNGPNCTISCSSAAGFRNTVFSAVLPGEIQADELGFQRAAFEDCDIVAVLPAGRAP